MNYEEWLEDLEDMELKPLIVAARAEYLLKGTRPWEEVEKELEKLEWLIE